MRHMSIHKKDIEVSYFCLMKISINSIGVIESPFTEGEDMPIQPGFSEALGTVTVDLKYMEGLKELDGFSHIILLTNIL